MSFGNSVMMELKFKHDFGDHVFNESFVPNCFGEDDIRIVFDVLEESWENIDGVYTRIIKKAKLLSVEKVRVVND